MTQNNPRVLFIHGLEGHPNGSKVRMLREQGFDVRAENMHMSISRLRQRNSAARNVLRIAEFRLLVLLLIASIIASALLSVPWLIAASVCLSSAWLALRRGALFAAGLRRSFVVCVGVQRRAILADPPDVLIGSSWGGAVAAELITSGVWTGPTVLLAPAMERVNTWAKRSTLDNTKAALRASAERAPLVIFHDPTDDVVPYADSVRFVEGTAIQLRAVDAGGHRLLDLLERGELAEAIREVTAPR